MTRARKFQLRKRQQFQTIDNFSASGAWSIDPIGSEWSERGKERLTDLLFSQDRGIGLSAWRFNIGAGSAAADRDIIPERDRWRRSETFQAEEGAPYDWSRHAGQRWFLQAAKRRGVDQFIAMVYSPPVWMTKNGHGQPDESVGTTNLKEGYEDRFARYMADIVRHFQQEEGIFFRWLSPVNEPSWAWNRSNQEANRYSNDDLKRVVDALDAELRRQGLNTRIDAPEAAHIGYLLDDDLYAKVSGESGVYAGHDNEKHYGGKYREFIKDFLGDETYRGKIGGKVCGHSYWTVDDRLLFRSRKALRANLDRYVPGAVYWQTEYCVLGNKGPGRDLGIGTALDVARVIHADLAAAGASAWHWWLSVSPHDYKDGLIYTDYQSPGDEETIYPSKTLWALGHYSRFVRPGFKRIAIVEAGKEVVDENDPLLASAYWNPDTGAAVIVFVNLGDVIFEVEIAGDADGAPGTLAPYVTSDAEGDDLRKAPELASGGVCSIPRRSIVTLVEADAAVPASHRKG